MRPTIDDQVEGARRLLTGLVDGDEVSVATRECLVNVRRLLDQIGRSWASLPGFYDEDSATLAALLDRTRAALPDTAAERIAAALTVPAPPATDVVAASAHNAELRALLSVALHKLPDDSTGTAARSEIGDYLRHRVASDPV